MDVNTILVLFHFYLIEMLAKYKFIDKKLHLQANNYKIKNIYLWFILLYGTYWGLRPSSSRGDTGRVHLLG